MGLLGAFIGKGENRGAILEALDRPIRSKTVETFKYGRKGSVNEGLVIEHTTKTTEFSVGDALALFIAGGIIYVASEQPVREFFADVFDPLDLGDTLGESGEALTDIVKTISETDTFDAIKKALKEAIDPFDLFS